MNLLRLASKGYPGLVQGRIRQEQSRHEAMATHPYWRRTLKSEDKRLAHGHLARDFAHFTIPIYNNIAYICIYIYICLES